MFTTLTAIATLMVIGAIATVVGTAIGVVASSTIVFVGRTVLGFEMRGW